MCLDRQLYLGQVEWAVFSIRACIYHALCDIDDGKCLQPQEIKFHEPGSFHIVLIVLRDDGGIAQETWHMVVKRPFANDNSRACIPA